MNNPQILILMSLSCSLVACGDRLVGWPNMDDEAPTVAWTTPMDEEEDVARNTAVIATFSEAMDLDTLTTASFSMWDATGDIQGAVATISDDAAVFVPLRRLAADRMYTATIGTGAKDLAGNALAEDYVWSFYTRALDTSDDTADDTGDGPWDLLPVDLGSLDSFVAAAGAGLTNSNSGGTTVLTGDVALFPSGTCLGDGSPCTETNPVINGTLYATDPGGVAEAALADLTEAYVDAMARPPGTIVEDLSGLTLPPGVYTSDASMSLAVGETVTLDGQGDSNAVWIFQIGSSLTVNNGASVQLIDGAKAKNVFWAAFASTTLGSDVVFQGNVLAGASNSVGTDSVVVGRLLCTTGTITLLSNAISLPTN